MTDQVPTSPNVSFCSTRGKYEQAKYALTWTKNVNKFHLCRSVAPSSRSITRFDCHAAVCLPDDV